MRIAVTGASGNVGARVIDQLLADPGVSTVLGIARRPPAEGRPQLSWHSCDIGESAAAESLAAALNGFDAVIHLAWLIQPSHQPERMRRTNVTGTRNVLAATVRAGVPAFVYASSLGAYSPGPDKTTRVDETWPIEGIPGSLYSAHKSEVERTLDAFQSEHPSVRVARIRPAIVTQRDAAIEQAGYFLGRFISPRLIRRSLVPILPLPARLVTQIVHAEDIADLFVRAALNPVASGAYNGADEPVLTPELIAGVFGAKLLPLPETALRALVETTWRLHLQPTDRGWLELALRSPLMSTERARRELGWNPRHSATETLADVLDGLAEKQGGDTAALAGDA